MYTVKVYILGEVNIKHALIRPRVVPYQEGNEALFAEAPIHWILRVV
jgi:hypothetical protein